VKLIPLRLDSVKKLIRFYSSERQRDFKILSFGPVVGMKIAFEDLENSFPDCQIFSSK